MSAYITLKVLLPVTLVVLLGICLRGAEGLSCANCYAKNGTYIGPECTPIPPGSCEETFRPCGCCPECAGQIGDLCHGMTVKCMTGLHCVNDKGEAREEVAWHHYRFRGCCQDISQPLPQPCIDPYDGPMRPAF